MLQLCKNRLRQGSVSRRAAVIGAGLIGSRMDAPGATNPSTHAGGYQRAGCELVAIMDISESVIEEALRWGAKPYQDFARMLQECRPELISFAVPAVARPELMMQTLACTSIKAVIAEKPLANSPSEARKIVEAYRKHGVPLIINYSRRFTPIWQELAGRDAISATIKYAKGVIHNGTHAIDLCRMLFGECLSIKVLNKKNDFWLDDPTVTAHMAFEGCQDVYLQGMDQRCFTLFEVDIVGENWRVVVDQDGQRAQFFELHNNVGIPVGQRLVKVKESSSGSDDAMLQLIMHSIDVAEGAHSICSGEDALAALEVASQLARG